MKRFTSAEEFIKGFPQWKAELECLREIILSTKMEETIKWGAPVYTLNGKNVVGLGAFKSYFGLWFFQGALLKDKAKVLMNAQEGKTKAMRQWRFNKLAEIDKKLVNNYILEALHNQEQGLEIKPQRKKKLVIPEGLKKTMDRDDILKNAFTNLNPGKQREYTEYIIEAKREETKHKRLQKIIPMILEGKGLNDKYK